MASNTHSYHCLICDLCVYAENPMWLAVNVNRHNTEKHPMDFAAYVAETIVKSMRYCGPAARIDQAIVPVSKEWGTAKAPVITAADRAMLAKGGVKWD